MSKLSSKEIDSLRTEYEQTYSSLAPEKQNKLKHIEELEHLYLKKYYHFLKYVENEMIIGFNSKEKIKKDWEDKWSASDSKAKISDFSTGAERIVYALLNGKGIGTPNSCPVGSDLMFELNDAFIHIDLKTVNSLNIGDYSTSIFVGKNQNSYDGSMLVNDKKTKTVIEREYKPNLPHVYTIDNGTDIEEKTCLSFLITILYDKDELDTLCITITSMPNGELRDIYKHYPLKAGKTEPETRYNFSKVPYFISLPNHPVRTRVIYLNERMQNSNELGFLRELYYSDDNKEQ